ncbi:KID-containing protein 1-like [Henckelia pumila]|uniref:KID-containing protein 1-like n=1 Tax=Henckelia pumila TaxID=405737 RepID=UPI003C6E8C5E
MSKAAEHGGGDGSGKIYVAVDSDSENSSIGIPSDDDVEDHGEAQSRVSGGGGGGGALNSLASLETSLPFKKGISHHYDGRSKSYSNLAETKLEEATELIKQEHAFNKKRRSINISQKFAKYSKKQSNNILHQSSMPTFPSEDHDEDEDGKGDDAENGAVEDKGSKAEG